MVLKLSDQDDYDTCVKEFTKESNVVFICGTYMRDMERDVNFSLRDAWNLLEDVEDRLPSSANIFCTQMINFMRALHYIQAASNSLLNVKTIKHVN